jgi:hypothetical protein
MSDLILEERIAALEKQVAEQQARLSALESPKDWRSTLGMFAEDEVMKRIFEAGRKIREADRQRGRKAMPARKRRVRQ